MKDKSLLTRLLLVILLGSCGNVYSQQSQLNKELLLISKDSALNWLKEGNYIAQIMDKYSGGKRVEFLSQKMSESVAKNQKWFLEYSKQINKGEVLPYHKNLGISKAEYEELLSLYKNNQLVSSGELPITIYRKEDMIHFESTGKLEALKLIKYDIINNEFLYWVGDEFAPSMILEDTINVSGHKGAYREWHGIKWRYKEGVPTDQEAEKITSLEGLSFADYSVTIGRTIDNYRMLSFELQIVRNGTSLTGGKRQLRILYK